MRRYTNTPRALAAYVREQDEHGGQARQLVDRVAQALRGAEFQEDTVVAGGDIRIEIIGAAQKCGTDWVVVGPYGRKGLEHFPPGSVSEAVARHAGCSAEIGRISSKH